MKQASSNEATYLARLCEIALITLLNQLEKYLYISVGFSTLFLLEYFCIVFYLVLYFLFLSQLSSIFSLKKIDVSTLSFFNRENLGVKNNMFQNDTALHSYSKKLLIICLYFLLVFFVMMLFFFPENFISKNIFLMLTILAAAGERGADEAAPEDTVGDTVENTVGETAGDTVIGTVVTRATAGERGVSCRARGIPGTST